MSFLNEESVKTALIGAAVGAGLGFLLDNRNAVRWGLVGGGLGFAKGHFMPSAGGHLLGGGHFTGRDYSFTRQPGYNGKDY